MSTRFPPHLPSSLPPFPVTLRITPLFTPCSLDLGGSAISISRHLFTPFHLPCRSSSPFRPSWSLFNIDFLSKGRKYRESIELRRPHSRLSSPVVCSTLCGVRGRKGCVNVHEMFAIAVLFGVRAILRNTSRNIICSQYILLQYKMYHIVIIHID